MDFSAQLRHFFHRRIVRSILWSIFALLVSAVFLFPLYWLFISSFKTDAEIFRNPPVMWPSKFLISNYTDQIFPNGADTASAVLNNSVLNSVKNSLIIAVCGMLISLVLAVPAAYGISRFRLPGARLILMYFLVTQMLPSSLLLTPLFLTFSRLKLLNSLAAPILSVTTITIPFTLMVLRPMFMACPREIEEAARIDGCNRGTAFVRVVMPIIRPGIVTCACFGFVHGWNDLVYSLTFNSKKVLFPMTSTIYNLMNEYGIRWNMIMAYGCMLVLPPLLIFIFGQKYVIGGMAGGAVKS